MDQQVLSYLAHTHTYDTSHSFASGGMVTPQCSLGQTKWTLSEAEARGEQRMRADAWREEGERETERERVEMGGMHHLEYSNRSYLMFVYLAIDSLYSSISLSISPSSFYTPSQHALTHTSFQWLSVHPLWSSLLPLTPLLPLSLAFQHKTPDIMWQVSA